MGRRTIYVTEGRERAYELAASMAGSLSRAIDLGIDLYIAKRRDTPLRCKEIEVVVGRGRRRVRKQFEGWEVGEFACTARTAGRLDGVTVYRTRGGRLAGWHWSDPDWAAVRSGTLPPDGDLDGDDDADEGDADPHGLDDWFGRRGERFVVTESVEGLCATLGLPQEARGVLEAVHEQRSVEVLDI